MALVGLSIIIVTLSFVCYNRLSPSWSLLTWFQRRSLLPSCRKDSVASASHREEGTENENLTKDEHKEDLDRRAMPPPPPPQPQTLQDVRNLSPPGTPKAFPTKPTPTSSTFTLETTTLSPISSFPAPSSIQRSSGGRMQPQRNHTPSLQAPLRSVSLVPPLPRSSLPNRSPIIGASPYLSLPPTLSAIPTKSSKRVLLSPGHSPLDWAYVSSRPDANLRGFPPATPYLRVTPSILRQHTGRKGKDAWTVLGGKVYNITPYLPYHPGGEPELMKAAGRDGTKLFGEVHPWVNWEGMLEPCLIGIAVAEEEARIRSTLEDMD